MRLGGQEAGALRSTLCTGLPRWEGSTGDRVPRLGEMHPSLLSGGRGKAADWGPLTPRSGCHWEHVTSGGGGGGRPQQSPNRPQGASTILATARRVRERTGEACRSRADISEGLQAPRGHAVRGLGVSTGSLALPSAAEAETRLWGRPAGRSLAGGHSGPAAQAHEHLLTIVQQPAVTELLERARRLGQHAHALPGRRQKAGRQVAGGQQQNLGLLPPRGPRLQLRRRACARARKHIRGGAAPGVGLGPWPRPCRPVLRAPLRLWSWTAGLPCSGSLPRLPLEHRVSAPQRTVVPRVSG